MKKTGKALSLVLSLALVVSSLTATFASAATTQSNDTTQSGGTVTATSAAVDIDAVSDGTAAAAVTSPVISDSAATVKFVDSKGYTYTNAAAGTTVSIAATDWVASGSSAYIESGALKVKGEGTTTFTATKSGVKVQKVGGTSSDTASVTAIFKFSVNVYKTGKGYIRSTATGNAAVGSIAVNAEPTIGLYTAGGTNAATPTWTAVDDAVFTSSNTSVRTITAIAPVSPATQKTAKLAYPTNGVNGTTQISATSAATPADNATAVVTVKPEFDTTLATTAVEVKAGFNSQVAKIVDNSITYGVQNYTISGTKNVTLTSGTVSKIDTTGTVVVNGGSVSNITENATSVSVTNGTVGGITAKGGTVAVSGGTVAAIKGFEASETNDTSTSLISVTKGAVGTIDTQGPVTINGGTVTAIAATGIVNVAATTASVPATVNGNITTDGDAFIGTTSQQAATKVAGTVAVKGNITIAENSTDKYDTSVGAIIGKAAAADGTYSSVLTFDGYTGTFASLPQFATVTLQNSSDVTVNAKLTVANLTLTSGKVTAPNAYVGTLTGPGTIAIPAGQLVVERISSTPVLSLTNKVAVGTLAYKSVSGMSDAFKCDGITFAENSLGNNVYGYTVKTVSLVGVTLPSSVKVAKGYTATVTATLNPASATLPDGASIKWSVPDGSSVSVVGNGMTATVSGLDWSDINLGGANNVTLTATIVDKDGNPLYEYATGSCTVTVIEKPEVVPAKYTSDTTTALSLKAGQQYCYKITSADGSDPTMVFGTSGVAKIVKTTVSGNAYFISVEGVKDGATGVYIGGSKTPINVITVAGTTFQYKSDTTVVTVKTGNAYTFKITADKGASAPVFQVCTFNSSKNSKETVLVNTVKNANGTTDYFYKIVATNSPKGAHGAYVNGVKVATVTVA